MKICRTVSLQSVSIGVLSLGPGDLEDGVSIAAFGLGDGGMGKVWSLSS